MNPEVSQLYSFIVKATAATYAGSGSYEKVPERPGFLELVFQDGDWHYRDSYTGFFRSRGTETVRHKGQVIWVSQYGGGMENGYVKLARDTFDFLKQAMLHKDDSIPQSFRGPAQLSQDDWAYSYRQDGTVEEFSGYEEIKHKDQKVFSQKIMGGIVVGKGET